MNNTMSDARQTRINTALPDIHTSGRITAL